MEQLTKQNIINVFYRMCRLQFGDNSYVPKMEHTFEYLKFDALDVKGLVMSLEEVFGIDMGDPTEDASITNLHGIFRVLMDKLVAAGIFVPRRNRLQQAEGEASQEEGDVPEGKDDDLDPTDDDDDDPIPADSLDGLSPEGMDCSPVSDAEPEVNDSEKLPEPPAEIDLGQADDGSPSDQDPEMAPAAEPENS